MYETTALRAREESQPRDPERATRLRAHVALASILLGFLAPIVDWILYAASRTPRGRWKRRLLALAIFDTALVGGLGLAGAMGLDLERVAAEPPRVGIVLDARDPPGGVVVERVAPGSPAAEAEIEPGDWIVAVDGKPIEHNRELAALIEATPEGSERTLSTVRDGTPRDVKVVPRTGRFEVAPRETGGSLFAPIETEHDLSRGTGRRFIASVGALDLLLVAVLTLVARGRHAPAAPGLVVLAGLLSLSLASSLVLLAFQLTMGLSLGAILVALLGGSVSLLVVGLVATSVIDQGPAQIGPRISTPKAIGLGALYGLTGAPRLALLLAVLVLLSGLPLRTASEAFGLEPEWGPVGIGLFLAATVVVAPVAEEMLFRGVLLPWLVRWMRPAAAVAWSAIVFAIGHLYYGAGALLIAYYGIVLGWARLRTGKLWAPIILHALLNGTTAAALLSRE
jgi:membrane protease YdiL (CAAX protease family)